MTVEAQIQANAQLAVEALTPLSPLGKRFGYNRESVEWVEGYLERMRAAEADKESIEGLISVLASFLGECIVSVYGGIWRLTENGWGVDIGKNNVAYPFNKVQKQFKNGVGAGDSILSFFDTIGTIQERGLPRSNQK